MSVEFPSDLQDFLIKQGRSVYFCGPGIGDHEELSDELALQIGQGWKRTYSDLLARLAPVAEECLYILSLHPDSPAPAMDYLSRFVVRSLESDNSNELFWLVAAKEAPHPNHYLAQLDSYELRENFEECRRYLELLVELGQ